MRSRSNLGDVRARGRSWRRIGVVVAAVLTVQGLVGGLAYAIHPTLVSISDATVVEPNSGSASAVFTVSVTPADDETITLSYATSDGTASGSSDYSPRSGTLTFAPGESEKQIAVPVNGDTLDEADETFNVTLSNVSGSTLVDGVGVGTIQDNDATPSLAIADAADVTEGATNASFTVSLSAPSGRTVTANYATQDGTAKAGDDYDAATGTVTFAPGEITKEILVGVNEDTKDETDEAFSVGLSAPSGATISDGEASATITDDDNAPTISVSDAGTVAEGDQAQFTINLSVASGRTVTAQYATADGSAKAGEDYTAQTGSVTFAENETAKTVSVPTTNDSRDEPDQNFFLDVSAPTNATTADARGEATISDNDGAPTFSVSDANVTEGDAGTSNATFTVTLSQARDDTVTVTYATEDGTATAGSDYQSRTGTLTFAAGETSKLVTVPVIGDLNDEPAEDFFLNLGTVAPEGAATVADGEGRAVITDNDSGPELRVGDVSSTEGNSGKKAFTFTVSVTPPSAFPITVDYSTANGTATAGTDYDATGGTLSFAPGEASKTITVQVNGDAFSEPDETFFVNLFNPSNATIADGSGTGTITNDDAAASAVSIGDSSVTEGDAGTTQAQFVITLSAAAEQTVTVEYATANETATAGTDYQSATGTVVFTPGQTSKTIDIAVNGDTLDEPAETFTVVLSDASNATLGDSEGRGTITDNDPAPMVSVFDTAVTEGDVGSVNAVFAVRLSAPSGHTVHVDYATADGTAAASKDYDARTGTVTFNPGETEKTVTVPVLGDLVDEPNETFVVNLSAPEHASIADGQATGTINEDEDPAPALTVSDETVAEGNAGSVMASFTVALSGPSGHTVTVQYATADGTATAGSDYDARTGTLTFGPGETQKTVSVPVTGDAVDEDHETFTLNLSSPTNATVATAEGGDPQGTATIQNDDDPPATRPEGEFHPLTPGRALDTRAAGQGPAVGAGQTRHLDVTGVAGVPATGVSAVALNVTVTEGTAPSYLRVFPRGGTMPFTSNLNFVTGETVPNAVAVKVGDGGTNEGHISLYNNVGSVHVIVDVVGWFSDGTTVSPGSRYTPLTPERILDTRPEEGGMGAVREEGIVFFDVAGEPSVPDDASGVILNVTATGGTDPTYLTVFPGDAENVPTASNLNVMPNQIIPNLVFARIGDDGTVAVYNDVGTIHVVVDLVGYFAAPGSTAGSRFVAVTPCRVKDTRNDGSIVGTGTSGQIKVDMTATAACPTVPATATGVAANTTVDGPTEGSYLTVYPDDAAKPHASNLNYAPGEIATNLVVSRIDAEGEVKVYNDKGSTEVIFDLVGYFVP